MELIKNPAYKIKACSDGITVSTTLDNTAKISHQRGIISLLKMKTVPSSAIALIVGCICLLQIQAFRQPKCRGKETKLTEEELKIMTDCIQEFGSKSGNFDKVATANMGCVGKCILQRQGLVDDNGMPVKETVFTIVNATMEPDVAKNADEQIGKCIDDNASGINPSENECKTYAPLVECIAKTFIQICQMNSTETQT